jgi:hypothetical protein
MCRQIAYVPSRKVRAKLFNNLIQFLGALAKMRKPTISFAMFVCPSVSLFIRMEQLGSL